MGNGNTKKSNVSQDGARQTEGKTETKESTTMGGKDDEECSQDEELLACCLCHCAVDYADRDAFQNESDKSQNNDGVDQDGDEEEEEDVLLPAALYDAQNTLVWCHMCERPYHQRCHFVPILAPPRATGWQCLVCKTPEYFQKHHHKKLAKQYKSKQRQAQIYSFPPADLSLVPSDAKQNATSGKVQSVTEQSIRWEVDTHSMKAQAWRREFARLQKALSQQLTNVRMAQMTLQAYTSTRRAQQYLTLQSQELSQTLVKLTSSKLKIKQLLQSLDQYRLGHDETKWNVLIDWLEQNPDEETEWFPFGRQHERRTIPRLQGQETSDTMTTAPSPETEVPAEVILSRQPSDRPSKRKGRKGSPTNKGHVNGRNGYSTRVKETLTKTNASGPKEGDDEDYDDLISLDDLKCCICLVGDATDENDLLMCDGAGCFRAYHRLCLHPVPSIDDVENENDWFCPICTALTELIASVQSEYYGDDWEKQSQDEDTIVSWEHVTDVFPEAEHEHEMTLLWQHGNENEETVEFLSSLLGFNASRTSREGDDNTDEGEEDEHDDEDFDMDEFQNPSRRARGYESSVASSQATLQDMSSVELNIGRSELNALSSGESSDEGSLDSDPVTCQRPRRSRRRRTSRAPSTTSGDSSSRPDSGTLRDANIIEGKRRRKRVDYRKLNDSMFGDISDSVAGKTLDDQEEYVLTTRKRSSSSSSGSSSDSSTGSTSEGESPSSASDQNKSDTHPNRENCLNRDRSIVDERSLRASVADSSSKVQRAATQKASARVALNQASIPASRKRKKI